MTQKQMVINYVPGEECRVAVVVDGRLEELHSERAGSVSYVGNIYVGKVMNVEAGIQAAFIDFGFETNGFLHVSDLHPRYFPGEEKTERVGKKTPRRERPPIQHCLKRGQEIVVQVLKEGINTKGPTLTSYLSIPGRYLVMLPWMDRVGVSRKVEDDEIRREMRKVLDTLELPGDFGFILRTAGIGRTKIEIKRDLAYLQRLWKDIEKRRKGGKQPRLLYAESDLLMRSLRDVWTNDVSEIVIDNVDALRRASRFMKIVSPRCSTRLLNYDRATPLFHAFGIEEQITLMHSREVPLPSGGSLVIDETEAMIAIDVNSGRMRNNADAETTAFKTNVEAVEEICRQLRLRDIGGLVVCDLIDMMKRSHRRDIEHKFRELLKNDRAATKVLPISQFGMVEMTRQRVRGSLRSVHFAKCPECSGRGLLQRPDSVASDAMRNLATLLANDRVYKVEMVVSPRVASVFLSAKRQTLSRLERTSNKHVDVRVSEDIPADRVVFYAYDNAGADIDTARLPMPHPPTDLPAWDEPGAEAEDWAVDVLREQEELPLEEEAVVVDGEGEVPQSAPGAMPGGAPSADGQGRKKRRRRGRRGRGGAGAASSAHAGAADEKSDAGAGESRATAAPSGPRAEAGTKAQADGEEHGDGRRRRRRRRRGRGGAGQGASVASGSESAESSEEHEVEREADEHRADGDAHTERADAGQDGQAGAPGRGKKRRRRGGRGRGRSAAAVSESGAEASSKESTPAAAPKSEADSAEKSERKGGRRRRRGGAGRGKGSESGAKPERSAPSAGSDKPAATEASKSAANSSTNVNGKAATGGQGRSLYSNRRRLKPTDVASMRGRRED